MKKRKPVVVFFLGLITFGIYDLYWLVQTKKVLNKETRFHTPSIWLLIAPGVILVAGYIGFVVAGVQNDINAMPRTSQTTSSSTQQSTAPIKETSSPGIKLGSSGNLVSTGEVLNMQGQRRPPQYVHICDTSAGIEYVTQGSPKCLAGDTYKSDYAPSVPGSLYSSPCKTTSGGVRYVYVANDETCPDGTSLVFYNSLGTSEASSSAVDKSGQVTFSTPSTAASTNNQIANPALFFASVALIIIGYLSVLVVSVFWFFRFSKAVDEYTKGKMSTAISFLILWLIHLIGVALIQDAFNDMVEEVPPLNKPVPPMSGVMAVAAATRPTLPAPVASVAPQPPSITVPDSNSPPSPPNNPQSPIGSTAA